MLRYLKFKVILTGCAVDIVGSIIIALLILTATTLHMKSQGAGLSEVQALLSHPEVSFPLLALILGGGMGADFFAGYITAREAPALELWHALVMISIIAILSIIGSGEAPVYLQIIKIIGGALAALSGAWIARQRK